MARPAGVMDALPLFDHDAFIERRIEQALLGLGRLDAQAVVDDVGRIEAGGDVAGDLLALRLVGHFAAHADVVAGDADLPPRMSFRFGAISFCT